MSIINANNCIDAAWYIGRTIGNTLAAHPQVSSAVFATGLFFGTMHLIQRRINSLHSEAETLQEENTRLRNSWFVANLVREEAEITYETAANEFKEVRQAYYAKRKTLGLGYMRYMVQAVPTDHNDERQQGIRRLSSPIIQYILTFCDDKSRLNFALTCRGAMRMERDPDYWRQRRLRDFPMKPVVAPHKLLEKPLYGAMYRIFVRHQDLTEQDMAHLRVVQMADHEKLLLRYCGPTSPSRFAYPKEVKTALRAAYLGCLPVLERLLAQSANRAAMIHFKDQWDQSVVTMAERSEDQDLKFLVLEETLQSTSLPLLDQTGGDDGEITVVGDG